MGKKGKNKEKVAKRSYKKQNKRKDTISVIKTKPIYKITKKNLSNQYNYFYNLKK